MIVNIDYRNTGWLAGPQLINWLGDQRLTQFQEQHQSSFPDLGDCVRLLQVILDKLARALHFHKCHILDAIGPHSILGMTELISSTFQRCWRSMWRASETRYTVLSFRWWWWHSIRGCLSPKTEKTALNVKIFRFLGQILMNGWLEA